MRTALAVLIAALSLALRAEAGTLIDLSAEASLPAANDLVRATLFSEASGANPAELARRVNGEIAEALKLARGKPGVKVQSGGQATYPVYGQGQKIEGWRMRSEIVLEAKDQAAVSALIGQLQAMRLAVGGVHLLPSPETRRQVGDEAIREAIRAFEQRAALVAGQFGKAWKIRQLTIAQGGGPQPLPRGLRAAAMAAEAIPLESGESLVNANVSGQIELAD